MARKAEKFGKLKEQVKEFLKDPRLDHLRKHVLNSKSDFFITLSESVASFQKDVNEWKITDRQHSAIMVAYLEEVDKAIKGTKKRAISESDATKNLQAFVKRIEKSAMVEPHITKQEAKYKEDHLKKLALATKRLSPEVKKAILAGAAGALSLLFGKEKEEKKEGKKTSKAKAAAAKVGDKLKGKKDKKKSKKKKGKKSKKDKKTGAKVRVTVDGKRISARQLSMKPSRPPGKVTRNIETPGKPPNYNLEARYEVPPKSLEEFREVLSGMPNRHQRNAYTAYHMLNGFIDPTSLKRHTVTVERKDENGQPSKLEFKVTNPLRAGQEGKDEEGEYKSMDVNLCASTAQVLVNGLGLKLPRPEMVKMMQDQVIKNGRGAMVLYGGEKLKQAANVPGEFGANMLTFGSAITAEELRQKFMKKNDLSFDDLLVGQVKMVAQQTIKNRINIRGGMDANQNTIQRETDEHEVAYNDAPQGVPALDPKSLKINGKPVDYDAFMNSPKYTAERKRFGFNEKVIGDYKIPKDLKNSMKPAAKPAPTHIAATKQKDKNKKTT